MGGAFASRTPVSYATNHHVVHYGNKDDHCTLEEFVSLLDE